MKFPSTGLMIMPAFALIGIAALAGCGSTADEVSSEPTASESTSAAATTAPATTAAAEATTSAAATTAAAVEAVIPEGYKVLTAANNGISFAIPADWIEMNATDIAGAVEGSTVLDEAAAQAGVDPAALLAVMESSDLMALSTDISSGFSNNVNVLAEPVMAESLPTESDMISVIEAVNGTPGIYETLVTPLGESAIMSYSMDMQGSAVQGAYLVLPAGTGEGFAMVTVSTLDAAETVDLVRAMAASATKAQ